MTEMTYVKGVFNSSPYIKSMNQRTLKQNANVMYDVTKIILRGFYFFVPSPAMSALPV